MTKIVSSRELALAATRRQVPLSEIGKNLSGVVKRWQDCGWAKVLRSEPQQCDVLVLTSKGGL